MDKYAFFQKVGYEPHEKQMAIHAAMDNHRFITAAAGARAGKSMAGGAEIAAHLLLPDFRIWVVSAVYELAEKEFNWALEFLGMFEFAGKRLIDLARVSNAARGSRVIEMPWKSFCRTRSTERSQTLLGEELDMIIMGEASQIPRAPWERMLRARIGPRNGKVLAISTPNSDAGLFMDFFENGKNEEEEWRDWYSIQFSVADNPTFDKEEIEIARKELDEKIFREQYLGEFVSRKGRVFPAFGQPHIFEEFPDGFEHWGVFRAIYHHNNAFNNPFVCLWVAIDPKNKDFWVYKEVWRPEILVSEIIAEIQEKSKGTRIIGTLTDFWNPSLQDDLRKNGLPISTNDEKQHQRKNAMVRRIQALQNALKIREEDAVQVHVHESCQETIRELTAAKWRDPQKEENEMAEHPLPSDKHISCPIALSFVVARLRYMQNIDIYSAQRPRLRAL